MIEIISGTNRPGAISAQMAQIYKAMLQDRGIESQVLDLVELPHDFTVSALYESSGANDDFNQLAHRLRCCDKMVVVVPEYNNSFPGVLKAFIDGMPYPSPFKGRKCAMVGLSSGLQGGVMAMSHLTDIFNYLGMHVLALKPRLGEIEKNMKEGQLTNARYRRYLEEQIEALIKF